MFVTRCFRHSGLLLVVDLIVALSPATLLGQERCRFELREVAAFALPDSFVVGGIASAGGRTVLWSPSATNVLVLEDSLAWRLGSKELSRPIGVAVSSPDGVSVLDRGLQAVVDFRHGQVSRSARRIPRSADRAIRTEKGWIAVEDFSASEIALSLIRPRSTTPIATISIPSTMLTDPDDPPILTRTADGMVVAQRAAPFGVWSVSSAGEVRRWKVISEAGLAPGRAPVSSRQIALPVIPISGCYVQLITDLENDRRWLRTFDEKGALLRVQAFPLPLSLIAQSADGQTILGTREVSHRELVVYRWRRANDVRR